MYSPRDDFTYVINTVTKHPPPAFCSQASRPGAGAFNPSNETSAPRESRGTNPITDFFIHDTQNLSLSRLRAYDRVVFGLACIKRGARHVRTGTRRCGDIIGGHC